MCTVFCIWMPKKEDKTGGYSRATSTPSKPRMSRILLLLYQISTQGAWLSSLTSRGSFQTPEAPSRRASRRRSFNNWRLQRRPSPSKRRRRVPKMMYQMLKSRLPGRMLPRRKRTLIFSSRQASRKHSSPGCPGPSYSVLLSSKAST